MIDCSSQSVNTSACSSPRHFRRHDALPSQSRHELHFGQIVSQSSGLMITALRVSRQVEYFVIKIIILIYHNGYQITVIPYFLMFDTEPDSRHVTSSIAAADAEISSPH